MRHRIFPAPPGSGSLPWLAGLLGACAAWNLGIDCAVPLAAFAAVAGLTLRPFQVAGAAAGMWAIDEAVQQLWLQVPANAATLRWAMVMLAVGVVATAAAWLIGQSGWRLWLRALGCLLVAFGVYEGGLYLAAWCWLGGTRSFAPAILGWAAAVNGLAFAAMLGLRALLSPWISASDPDPESAPASRGLMSHQAGVH